MTFVPGSEHWLPAASCVCSHSVWRCGGRCPSLCGGPSALSPPSASTPEALTLSALTVEQGGQAAGDVNQPGRCSIRAHLPGQMHRLSHRAPARAAGQGSSPSPQESSASRHIQGDPVTRHLPRSLGVRWENQAGSGKWVVASETHSAA